MVAASKSKGTKSIEPPTSASPQSPTSPSGIKRKRPSDIKFYAIHRGRKPGVYETWEECLDQVKGFKNALFQSFPTHAQAQAFVNGHTTAIQPSHTGPPRAFYGVAVGRSPGVYTDWPSCQAQIVGWKGPKFKKFATKAEAEQFVKSNNSIPTVGIDAGHSNESKRRKVSEPGFTDHDLTDANGEVVEPGTGPLPPGAEDGFDPNIKLSPDGTVQYKSALEKNKKRVISLQPAAMLNIYTDGSCTSNGIKAAKAGVGVYFGPGDPQNVSEGLKGTRQTNQRAELTAVQRALEIAPRYRDVTIFTDSKYAIDCVTNWFTNWEKNGWLTATKKPVENKDLIQEIRSHIVYRDKFGKKTLFNWVKGHNNNPGNTAADKLALNGARANFAGGGTSATVIDDENSKPGIVTQDGDVYTEVKQENGLSSEEF